VNRIGNDAADEPPRPSRERRSQRSAGSKASKGGNRAAGKAAEARAEAVGNAANPRIGARRKPGSLQEEKTGEVVETAGSERRRVARERGGNPRLEGYEPPTTQVGKGSELGMDSGKVDRWRGDLWTTQVGSNTGNGEAKRDSRPGKAAGRPRAYWIEKATSQPTPLWRGPRSPRSEPVVVARR